MIGAEQMTEAQSLQIVATIAATWPNYPLQDESPAAYRIGLEGIPYQAITAALAFAIKTRKWAPTPADLRSIALEHSLGIPTPEAAWVEVQAAIRSYGHNQIPMWSTPAIAAAVRVMGWQALCMSERPDSDRRNFIDAYTRLRERTFEELAGGPPALAGLEQPSRDRQLPAPDDRGAWNDAWDTGEKR